VRAQDWTTLHERLSERIRTFIDGDEDKVRSLLDDYLTSALHNEVERDGLVTFLTENGCPPREWSTGAGGLSERFAQAARDFIDAANRNLISAQFMAREQTAEIAELLDRRDPPGTVFIVGKEGCGKSAALATVVQQRVLAGQPVLAVDVQTLSQERDVAAVGSKVHLPMPPAAALAAAAGDTPAVLFLDAVDAVGSDRGAPFELYTVIDRIIKDTRAHPNLTLVMTCRQEDFDADDRLRALLRERAQVQTVELPPLTARQVRGAVELAGGTPSDLSAEQLEILRLPSMLKLFVGSLDAGPADFSTKQELLDRYYAWTTRDDG
jgi:ATPase family associated with various cellular activities (AAA)